MPLLQVCPLCKYVISVGMPPHSHMMWTCHIAVSVGGGSRCSHKHNVRLDIDTGVATHVCHLGICACNAGGLDSSENRYSEYMDCGCVAQPWASLSIGLPCPGPVMPEGSPLMDE